MRHARMRAGRALEPPAAVPDPGAIGRPMRIPRAVSAGALALLVLSLLGETRPPDEGFRHMTVYLRRKPQALRVYEPPPGAPRRPFQILVTSGDVGWLQISESLPRHLQAEGYRVVGLNAQTYVASFTGDHGEHLEAGWIPRDYDTIMQAASVNAESPAAFVSIGVSEGAGLAVLAMGQPGASELCKGVMGLGMPVHTALGWRWTDFVSWITKAEPNEPLADTGDYMERLRVPLVVVHSLHDEYDAIANVRAIFATAPVPKRFFAVNAPNHRFSRHVDEVYGLVDTSLAWLDSLQVSGKTPIQAGEAPGLR